MFDISESKNNAFSAAEFEFGLVGASGIWRGEGHADNDALARGNVFIGQGHAGWGGHGGAADKDDRIVFGPGAGTVVSQGPGLGIADARRELRAIGDRFGDEASQVARLFCFAAWCWSCGWSVLFRWSRR